MPALSVDGPGRARPARRRPVRLRIRMRGTVAAVKRIRVPKGVGRGPARDMAPPVGAGRVAARDPGAPLGQRSGAVQADCIQRTEPRSLRFSRPRDRPAGTICSRVRQPDAFVPHSWRPALNTTFEGARLLLVEDEFVLALGLSDVLEDLGAQVLGPVSTVAGALELISKIPEIDAAVLDINLGDDVVFPVADALVGRGVPFLFVSGYDAASLPARFRSAAFCQKPFDVATFKVALQQLQ